MILQLRTTVEMSSDSQLVSKISWSYRREHSPSNPSTFKISTVEQHVVSPLWLRWIQPSNRIRNLGIQYHSCDSLVARQFTPRGRLWSQTSPAVLEIKVSRSLDIRETSSVESQHVGLPLPEGHMSSLRTEVAEAVMPLVKTTAATKEMKDEWNCILWGGWTYLLVG